MSSCAKEGKVDVLLLLIDFQRPSCQGRLWMVEGTIPNVTLSPSEFRFCIKACIG